MRKYIVIREFKIGDLILPKQSIIEEFDGKYCLYEYPQYDVWKVDKLPETATICLLELCPDLLTTVFHSQAYVSWMNERAIYINDSGNIDEQGHRVEMKLRRTPETMVMYLMDLGLSSDQVMKYLYGPDNKYLEYLYQVQQFGKL